MIHLINKSICLILFLCLSMTGIQAQTYRLENVSSFFPHSERLTNDNIDWGILHVPENWDNMDGNQVQVKVAVLKKINTTKENAPVVFIQGGPGGSGMSLLGSWIDHPLRENSDIVILDIRGTGISEPRLCPDLGNEFLKIYAKDQPRAADEKDKIALTLDCQRDLLSTGIDISSYNSLSVSKDLNALKKSLGYKKWSVYGVSYGTFITQVYMSNFPEDIDRVILDSPIDDIGTYYAKNTINFTESLNKVFSQCENDPDCNAQYPDLNEKFNEIIEKLKNEPISVLTSDLESPNFTFNAEDFKLAVQQALYHKELVEVIPILVYQFYNGDKNALSNLIPAFSSLLSMDYGIYYCFTCNEVLNKNSQLDAQSSVQQSKNTNELSFYKSDVAICKQWNENRAVSSLQSYDLSNLGQLDIPTLLLAGEYDPITPSGNAERLNQKLLNAKSLFAYTYGHAPGFSSIGEDVVQSFVNNPKIDIDKGSFLEASKIVYATDIRINKGVSKMGNSLSEFNPLFVAPLIFALLVILVLLISYLINLVKVKHKFVSDKLIRILGLITSVIGVILLFGFFYSLIQVSNFNSYILAFGLPESYDYLFTLLYVYAILLLCTVLYYFIKIKKISNRSMFFSLIFSNMVILVYFFYWGVI